MKYRMMTDEEIINDLADQFDKLRIQKRLKDTDVESAGGTSRQVLSSFRNGKRSITLKSFIRLLRGINELDRLEKLLPVSNDYSPGENKKEDLRQRVRDHKSIKEKYSWGDED